MWHIDIVINRLINGMHHLPCPALFGLITTVRLVVTAKIYLEEQALVEGT